MPNFQREFFRGGEGPHSAGAVVHTFLTVGTIAPHVLGAYTVLGIGVAFGSIRAVQSLIDASRLQFLAVTTRQSAARPASRYYISYYRDVGVTGPPTGDGRRDAAEPSSRVAALQQGCASDAVANAGHVPLSLVHIALTETGLITPALV